MNPGSRLKYHRSWVGVGMVFVVLQISLSLMHAPPVSFDFEDSDKVEHLASYALLMGWFMQIYERRAVRAGIALALATLGFTLEILQGLGGVRQFDYLDAAANATGIMVAWLLVRPPLSQMLWHLERRLAI